MCGGKIGRRTGYVLCLVLLAGAGSTVRLENHHWHACCEFCLCNMSCEYNVCFDSTVMLVWPWPREICAQMPFEVKSEGSACDAFA